MERKMLHQVGNPPQNLSDIAKQIVQLAGHSLAALDGVGVKYFVFDSKVLDLVSALLQYFVPHVLNKKLNFFELGQNTPMVHTWKTKMDIFTYVYHQNKSASCYSQSVCIVDKTQNNTVTTCHIGVML